MYVINGNGDLVLTVNIPTVDWSCEGVVYLRLALLDSLTALAAEKNVDFPTSLGDETNTFYLTGLIKSLLSDIEEEDLMQIRKHFSGIERDLDMLKVSYNSLTSQHNQALSKLEDIENKYSKSLDFYSEVEENINDNNNLKVVVNKYRDYLG